MTCRNHWLSHVIIFNTTPSNHFKMIQNTKISVNGNKITTCRVYQKNPLKTSLWMIKKIHNGRLPRICLTVETWQKKSFLTKKHYGNIQVFTIFHFLQRLPINYLYRTNLRTKSQGIYLAAACFVKKKHLWINCTTVKNYLYPT